MTQEEAVAASILVVDDEVRIRDACSMVLKEEGYRVDVAENGEQGLAMIEKTHYDVILLDLMMPAFSGFEVLPLVTKKHPDTAVVIITGYATVEHSIEAMKKGAFDFIPKPFTPDQLRAVVLKSIRYTSALQDIVDARSRLKRLVDRLSDGVLTVDTEGRIIIANRTFMALGLCRDSDVLGKVFDQVIEEEQVMPLTREALAGRDDVSCEIVLGKDEVRGVEERIVTAHGAPFMSRSGKILGATVVFHDITTRVKIDKLKSDFVSMVSHEIRSPMNSLLAQIQIILDGLAGDVTEKQREILERASGKVNNLVSLVSELLDLAKIEAGILGQEMEDVDLQEVLTEQVEFLRAAASEKEIVLTLQSSPLPQIWANRQGIEQLITNLISNATKYSPRGGAITVTAAEVSGNVVLTFSDSGFGMSEEDLPQIFTRFYRIKDSNTRDIHGTGLGLAVVKSIVDAHDGTIEVASKLGEGSVFTVTLPVKEAL